MINLRYIDLFCGAGGTTSGVEYARVDGEKCAKVIACVNHDRNAILSHKVTPRQLEHVYEEVVRMGDPGNALFALRLILK